MFLGILGPPYCGIGATIRISQEMLGLPYAGFLADTTLKFYVETDSFMQLYDFFFNVSLIACRISFSFSSSSSKMVQPYGKKKKIENKSLN